MAGTLTIGTLSDGTNSAPSTDAIKGSARAWVNFNGVTTATIRASYNVSSVTRNASGDYTVNFTNALADANYAFMASCGNTTGVGTNPSVTTRTQLSTTTSARVILNGATGTGPDLDTISVSIFR
jgi:hypothetical protein